MLKGHEVAINSNSHKLLEYLATGRPVVINYTDEYKNNDLVVMAQDNEALPLLFSKVINTWISTLLPELSRGGAFGVVILIFSMCSQSIKF